MNTEILKDGIWNAVTANRHEDIINFINNGVDVNFQKHGFTLLFKLLHSLRWDKEEDMEVLQAFINAGVDTRQVNNHCKRLPIFGIVSTREEENFSHHEIKIKAFKMLFDKEKDADNEELLKGLGFSGMHECLYLFNPSKKTLENAIKMLNTEVRYALQSKLKANISKSIDVLQEMLKEK